MAGGQAVIVAGIGCRKGCPAAAIEALLQAAEARAGAAVDLLASAAFKAGEAGLLAVAERRGLRLQFADRDALVAVAGRCPSLPSAAALHHHGVPSVAEAAALAIAGPEATLILPRLTGAGATCALARTP